MDYFETVQHFVEVSRRESSDTALAARFEEIITDLGCTHYACMSHVNPIDAPPGSVILQNYPDGWSTVFFENRYERFDPVLETSVRRNLPWLWNEPAWQMSLSKQQKELLDAAGEFGLRQGYSIPLNTNGLLPATCSVAFDNEIDPAALHAIHIMATYLHEAAARIHNPRKINNRNILLTNQQRRCLELAAQGKSDWAIGQILSISHHTVNRHICAAMSRLGVATRVQAAIRALYLGEIRYFDVIGTPAPKENRIEVINRVHASCDL